MHGSSEGAAKKRIFVWAPSPGGAGRGSGCEQRLGGPPLNPGEIAGTFVAGCQPSLSPGNGELACFQPREGSRGKRSGDRAGVPFHSPGGLGAIRTSR